jgi:hypothetical protein
MQEVALTTLPQTLEPLLHQPRFSSGEAVQRSSGQPYQPEEIMVATQAIQTQFADAESMSVDELEYWLAHEPRAADGQPLAESLLMPLRRIVDATADYYRRGPLGFDPDFSQARFPRRDLDRLRCELGEGVVNYAVVELYPDSEWLADRPDVSSMPVFEFVARKAQPLLDKRHREWRSTSSRILPRLADFRAPASNESLLTHFAAAIESRGIVDPLHLLSEDFFGLQSMVYARLPVQPTVNASVGQATIRFISVTDQLEHHEPLPVPSDPAQHIGSDSLASLVLRRASYDLLTVPQWTILRAVTSTLGLPTPLGDVALAAITTHFVAVGRGTPETQAIASEYSDSWLTAGYHRVI